MVEILSDADLQKLLVNELMRFLKCEFQEKIQKIAQLIKHLTKNGEFQREKAIQILKQIKEIEGPGPRCFFCNEPLQLSVFLGIEETLIVTSQCPECEMNWFVEEKDEKAFIESLGGEEKVISQLIALTPRTPKVEVQEDTNSLKEFKESVEKFFADLLKKKVS